MDGKQGLRMATAPVDGRIIREAACAYGYPD